jgi:hypothetical protein
VAAKSLFATFTPCTDLRDAKNLTPEQIKQVNNWKKAKYDPQFREKLGL